MIVLTFRFDPPRQDIPAWVQHFIDSKLREAAAKYPGVPVRVEVQGIPPVRR